LYVAELQASRDIAPLEAKARRSVVILGASIFATDVRVRTTGRCAFKSNLSISELFIKGAEREDIDLRCILVDSDVRASG
jgi:hypothetical protein